MYPINDCRILRVIIQCQNEKESMIEMEFQDLKYLKLFPTDPHYTCEILDSTILLKDDSIIWCDCANGKDIKAENDAKFLYVQRNFDGVLFQGAWEIKNFSNLSNKI